jgi:hypothetical protein
MRFFGKLISRLKGPPAPTLADFAIAIDTLAAQSLAHHRLVGVLMGHVVALTPPERRRDIINAYYSGIDHSKISKNCGLSGVAYSEIGRLADEISNNLVDAIATGATPLKPPGHVNEFGAS